MYDIFNDSIDTSGNNTTLERISKILELNQCNIIKNNIIGIHAFKFGGKVINKNYDYILIIGGTDINIDINDDLKKEIIINAIIQSRYTVCFSKYLEEEIIKLNVVDSNKIKVIPQSVSYVQPDSFCLKSFVNKTFSINNYNKIYLVVGNIRKVKGPNFLDEIARTLYNQGVIILFIGKVIDKDVEIKLPFLRTERLKSKEIYACYEQADGLINISESEGMSSAILEAMIYKCPVYARNNKGNLSIIDDKKNGYIFKTSNDFLEIINFDTKLIVENAYNYVLKYHNSKLEKEGYSKLIY